MNKQTVECMSKVSGILAKLKVFIRENSNDSVYEASREMINDCQAIMAVHCDCAPIKLIAGRVDDILENLEYIQNTEPDTIKYYAYQDKNTRTRL